MLAKLKRWAHRLKLNITTVYIASKDARTPRLAKLLAVAVVAYAFSPIDLIPDFIPVLGLLDDLIIVPAGIALIIRLVPQELMSIYRQNAKASIRPASNWLPAVLIIGLWILFGVVTAHIAFT